MPATIDGIRAKVRRLTLSPSVAQLTAADLDNYINDFLLYDFPESIRLFNLRQQANFYTQPYRDLYDSSAFNIAGVGIGQDFLNEIYTIHPPIYIAGQQAFFSQSREEFFGVYPFNNTIVNVDAGDGATVNFIGTLANIPIMRNQVTFSSIDINNVGLTLRDDGEGNIFEPGTNIAGGVINYVTGAFNITFTAAPADGQAIVAKTVPITIGRPEAVLFYDGAFTVRPVPDQSYPINFEYYVRPTALDDLNNPIPQLEEWWQYIAYGAAIHILQERLVHDTVNLLMPEFKNQERLILRRTIVQQTNERVATIYTEATGDFYGPGVGGRS